VESESIKRGRRRGAAIFLACLSAAVTVPGILALVNFDSAPGRESLAGALPPASWPRGTAIHARAGRFRLLMFVHPLCACTSASISGLARIAAGHRLDRADVAFIVFRPDHGPRWDWTAWPEVARSLPGSRMIWDNGGAEARVFAARTSGRVILYSPAGKLLFQGGITGSRGHEGDNYGLSRLSDLLVAPVPQSPIPVTSRAFGCELAPAVAIPGRAE